MGQLHREFGSTASTSSPADDFIVINADAGRVVVEINEWCTRTRQHYGVKLQLHHSEALLLADMLNRNADQASRA